MPPHLPLIRVLASLAAGALCAATTVAATTPPTSGVELANFDLAVRPQDDFYRYVDGGWLARTEIPADRARWGSFDILNDRARGEIRAILDAPVPAGSKASADTRKLKTYYDSYMDEATVDALGTRPVAPELARIRAIRSKADVAAEFAHLDLIGAISPIEFAVHLDNKDSTRYILDLFQGGLGMPDRDYYLKDDAKLSATRTKYIAYVGALLTLAGDSDGAAKADQVFALEKRIAEAQWTKTENRDPVKTYNRMDTAKLPDRGGFTTVVTTLAATPAPVSLSTA